MPCICVLPAVEGIGGMSAFRQKFEAGLSRRGIQVTHEPRRNADAILIIAATRRLRPILAARRGGVRVIQRLDGINWIHRRRKTGMRHFLRAEYGNLLLSLTRARVSTHILYQSEFTRHWWGSWYGVPRKPSAIVLNGVDLDEYQPGGTGDLPGERIRLLVVEGNLGGGYDMGLDNALQLAGLLQQKHGYAVELYVVGRIERRHQARVESRASVPIVWGGTVSRQRIPEIHRSAHLLFSADLNPACPNAVIEALACGTPVVAFDTGAMSEIVTGDSGRLVPYGGDVWRLEQPHVASLADASAEILRDRSRFSRQARLRAEEAFGLDKMMDGYLRIVLEA